MKQRRGSKQREDAEYEQSKKRTGKRGKKHEREPSQCHQENNVEIPDGRRTKGERSRAEGIRLRPDRDDHAKDRRTDKSDISWEKLDMTLMSIVIEATALVLSGELDKLEEKSVEAAWKGNGL